MRILAVSIVVFLYTGAYPQIVLEESLRIPLFGLEKQYGIVPAGEKGMVIFNEARNNNSASKRIWEITMLDTLLNPIWKSFFESDYNFKISHVKYYDGLVYLLFQDLNIPMKSAFFVRGNVTEDKFEIFELKDFLPDQIIGLEILGNSLFLMGIDGRRPSILKYRYGDPRPLVLKGLSTENTELLSASLVPGHNLIQIITRMKKRQGRRGVLAVKQFDESGRVHKDIVIESTRGHDLINCEAMTDLNGNICVVGTFAYTGSKMSNGIFTMVHDGEHELPVYYYEYTNLHNYFNYLSPKEKDKIIKKYKLEDSISRSSKYKMNQIPREIVRTDQGWIYIGEMVKYSEKNSRIYGNMWQMEYRIYSHALLLGIGTDGKLKWDASVSLDNLTTGAEVQQVHFNVFEDQVILFFQTDGNIFYEAVHQNRQGNRYGNLNLFGSNSEDSGEFQVRGVVLPWYKNKYIAFGSFHTRLGENESTKLFYINKLSVSPDKIPD
ncbi:MAG: hypothetical protein MI975_06935 [Cytophagales bacterium]|nr:hypothetical protein [Cytophagales bacterium]